MAKYLPDYGWTPVVLCQRWTEDNCDIDADYVKGIPAGLPKHELALPAWRQLSLDNLSSLLAHPLLPHVRREGFLFRGMKEMARLLDDHRVDAIWATAPEASAHLLASWVSHRFGIPWIADYRDITGQARYNAVISLLAPVKRWNEARYLETASKITTVSPALADKVSQLTQRDVDLVYNGFDPTDLSDTPTPHLDEFALTYTGSVSNRDFPDFRVVLDGIQMLVESGCMDRENVFLRFSGDALDEPVQAMFGGHPLEEIVHVHGSVPRKQCIELQRQSAVLLQNAFPGRRGIMTSKVFSYLAARRPILAVPQDGDCIDALLRETGAGLSLSTAEDIAGQLGTWYQEWEATGTVLCGSSPDAIMRYSRKSQAGELAELLNAIAL